MDMNMHSILKKILFILLPVLIIFRFTLSFINRTGEKYLFLFGQPQLLAELLLYLLILLCVGGLIILYSEKRKSKINACIAVFVCFFILAGIFMVYKNDHKIIKETSPYSSARKLIIIEGESSSSFYFSDGGLFLTDTKKRLSHENYGRPFSSSSYTISWLTNDSILLQYGNQQTVMIDFTK